MKIDPEQAVHIIQSGGIVAIPTETVYGLAADAFNTEAVRNTFLKKGRPADNPLIVHISDIGQLDKLIVQPPEALKKLTAQFWPGPLTLVLEKHPSVPDIVSGGLRTVAVRMPDHPITRKLINRCGPLTAPSANKSGRPSPTKADHVEDDFGKDFPVVDGGDCEIGLESTVIDLSSHPFTILRPGAVSKRALEECLDQKIISETELPHTDKPASPGVKYTHYKPQATVYWIESLPLHPHDDTLYLIHSNPELKGLAQRHKNILSFSGNFQLLAKRLYDLFRYADHQNYAQIAIEKLPDPSENDIIPPLFNRISKAIRK
ncbi:L-threonylcarbamoyladenylate synthase [Rhodohalobacter mucosus]|uniref:Threonylcarbamoyl-AMP synthase n=1 Tax=Rhodohalobacter mucosus TaxID=2079485 RepID=A0A316TXS5_9BACT|nr:L-threonylcarbamoyladenylate synthase [Rhodohalobacter mucosus]PWN07484.1 threonylcarbamoyl-AMP synthase [Rhodohalobacter mucosus]